MNNESKKPEQLIPEDSEQKNIRPAESDESVLKKRDLRYDADHPDLADPQPRRTTDEQPVKSADRP